MSEEVHPIVQLLRQDSRFTIEAYQFVRDALSFAQEILGMGSEHAPEDEPEEDPGQPHVERHLTGQQLCEAIRQYALDQYGYMAKVVLNRWGVTKTGDFGDIVYNLIDVKLMKKSAEDRREDFDDVYDFDTAFQQQFEITMPE
ncbi:MAG: hypothetical protein RIC55_08795 [Pirellulaceae bacterium]